MTGHGAAWGAVTIINATATGHGCSLAIDAPTEATWTWGGEGMDWQGETDDTLARAVLAVAQDWLDRRDGATADAQNPMPPSRGLKTSSSAAAALLRAALDVPDAPVPSPERFDALCIEAARKARVTLTGAYDDHVAVAHGGCALTDNAAQKVLRRIPVKPWHVAIWVPEGHIRKSDLANVDAAKARRGVEDALRLLRSGDIPGALTRNGEAYHPIYEAAGLPVDDAPVRTALRKGALGAGLSGTGPAVAALFERPVELPDVSGGTWRWQHAVEAT